MSRDLSILDLHTLQSLLAIETEKFLSSLEDGTQLDELYPMNERIKELRNLIESKQQVLQKTSNQ
ncbi:MAG TPA: hypothetical protein VF622_08620 [Segetibacter sp.]|jgi:hypothetical protein